MAISRAVHQLSHIVIVVAYTVFCVAVLGVEQPILRMVVAIVSGLPMLWAVWTLALARLPAETMRERLREAFRIPTTSAQYREVTDEVLAISRDARALLQLSAAARSGQVTAEAAFRRANQIEMDMKRRVERIGELAGH